VVDRMRAAIDEIGERHPGEHIVVLSHGAAIIAYLTDVLQLEPGRLRMLPYYTSISVVRALGDRRMVARSATWPTSSERKIREDLEAQLRDKLGRPGLRVTAVEPIRGSFGLPLFRHRRRR